MYHEGDIIDTQKIKEILEKNESQKSEQERDFIKEVLKQSFLFKQLQEEIKFQQQEVVRENNLEGDYQNKANNNILDMEILLNRTQRNIKYMRVPNNQFLFHKGDAGDRLFIIIKGHAAVYTEREKSQINKELTKEKNLTKQIQLLSSKILHYEHQVEVNEKKIQEDILMEQQLYQQIQLDDSEANNNENEQIIFIRKQQRKKDEIALAQIKNTILDLNQELDNCQKELKNLISQDQEILKKACGNHKELIGKYFTLSSPTRNVCYYSKLKTLEAFNHLGEASIITNEKRTATVLACSSPYPPSLSPVAVLDDLSDNMQSCDTQESFQSSTQHSSRQEDVQVEDEDLHLLYMEANIFIGLFSATLDQINYPLTILSKILTHTSKDLLVRLSYLFNLNEHKFNSIIFSEGVDLANCVYLIKKGQVQLQRNAQNDELEKNLKGEKQIQDDCENLKMKTGKKNANNKKQVVMAVIGEGQFFGLEDIPFKNRDKTEDSGEDTDRILEKNQKRTCSAVALTSCLIYVVSKSVLLTQSYQFQELQQKLVSQSKVKQQFYLNQAEKNNKIQHYLEQEINRMNQQPQVDKTIIQMSMNHHKQMMIDSNKISNMMDTYIKTNKDALNHQKEILQMAHGRGQSLTREKNDNSNKQNDKSSAFSPTKVDYGRVKELLNRNSAEIAYAHKVQQENEKALNIKENAILSVMPQSQKNVKDILRAQRYYSKSKDAHNKNIRLPSRQNLNDTVFISQSQTNLMTLNNNDKLQHMNTKNLNQMHSVSEFDDNQTNPPFKIERKNNVISVKKVIKFNTQASSILSTPGIAPIKDSDSIAQNDTKFNHLKSLCSTTYNTPLINPIVNQTKKIIKNSLKSINSSTQNTPLMQPLELDNATHFELNDNTESIQQQQDKKLNKSKVIFSLSSMKSIELDNKQFYHSSSLPKYNISDKNIFHNGNITDRSKNTKFIKLRKESDNISQSQNESFAKSELIGSSSIPYLNNNKFTKYDKNLVQDQSIDGQKQSLQVSFFRSSQFVPKSSNNSNQNSEKKSVQFKQIQNFVGSDQPEDQLQNYKLSMVNKDQQDEFQLNSNYRKGRKNSLEHLEIEEKQTFLSPILNPSQQFQQHQSTQSFSQFSNPKIQQFIPGDSYENQKKQKVRMISQDQTKNDKSKQYFLSQANLELQDQPNNQTQYLYSSQMKIGRSGLSNDSRFSTKLRTPYKYTPQKTGKLKSLLPMLSPQQQEETEYIQSFNPFQARRLQPSYNKTPAY